MVGMAISRRATPVFQSVPSSVKPAANKKTERTTVRFFQILSFKRGNVGMRKTTDEVKTAAFCQCSTIIGSYVDLTGKPKWSSNALPEISLPSYKAP